jgi:hypothetical protein
MEVTEGNSRFCPDCCEHLRWRGGGYTNSDNQLVSKEVWREAIFENGKLVCGSHWEWLTPWRCSKLNKGMGGSLDVDGDAHAYRLRGCPKLEEESRRVQEADRKRREAFRK